MQAIEGRNGLALVHAISTMINNTTAVEYREREVRRFPGLLTIEDYVGRDGGDWGFDPTTVNNADANARWLDQVAGFRRYI